MGTLTVGAEWSRDGADFKKRLDRFLIWFLRAQNAKNEAGEYESIFWFLEFQKRGAPHVHMFYTSRVPWGRAARKWSEIMEDPSIERTGTKFEKLRSSRGGMLAYARKYAAKDIQKSVPEDYGDVGRFWGVRGCRICATCHVTVAGINRGRALLDQVTEVLEGAVRSGLLRRLAWVRGEGFVYFPRRSGATLYSIGVGQAVDLVLMRHGLS